MPRRRVDMSEKWPGRALPDHSRLTSIRLLAPVRLTRRLCRSPKALECPPVWRFPQLLKRPFPDLPDSFPGDAQIGRASCRERVYIAVVGILLRKKEVDTC